MAPRTATHTSLTADFANELIRHAAAKAQEIGQPMAIAVADDAGHLKAYLRMDGAPLIASELAQDKAYTSAASGMTTEAWFDMIKDDPPLAAGMPFASRLVVYGGGVPVIIDGVCVGAVGASGGHYSDDSAVAGAALNALA